VVSGTENATPKRRETLLLKARKHMASSGLLALVLLIASMSAVAMACSTETVEVTREVQVEVTREVEVEVEKQVEVEVTREVEKEVVVEKEVEVVVEVTTEVEKEPIVFSDLNWTSSELQVRIARFIVEHGYGYPTDAVAGDTISLFEGLKNNDTDVTMEIWLPNQQEVWTQHLRVVS
jgi:hypothetical protein